MKRGQTNLNFLIGINKPSGMTSHDVVNKIRNICGEGRVGHMGTLDPMACGVMLIGIGSAARLNNYLECQDKSYTAKIRFGISTNTYDSEGEILQENNVPSKFLNKEFAKDYLDGIVGVSSQKPPAFSAIKKNGKPAYKAARSGNDIELEPREIEIYKADLIDIEGDCWIVNFEVSKGTYIRSIAHDIGSDLGCGACLNALTRTKIGSISLDQCYSYSIRR